jgi:hypothetical protein
MLRRVLRAIPGLIASSRPPFGALLIDPYHFSAGPASSANRPLSTPGRQTRRTPQRTRGWSLPVRPFSASRCRGSTAAGRWRQRTRNAIRGEPIATCAPCSSVRFSVLAHPRGSGPVMLQSVSGSSASCGPRVGALDGFRLLSWLRISFPCAGGLRDERCAPSQGPLPFAVPACPHHKVPFPSPVSPFAPRKNVLVTACEESGQQSATPTEDGARPRL